MITWATETVVKKSFKLMVVGSDGSGGDATLADLCAAAAALPWGDEGKGALVKAMGYTPTVNAADAERDSWKQRAEEAERHEADACAALDRIESALSPYMHSLESSSKCVTRLVRDVASLRSELARVAKVVEAARAWRKHGYLEQTRILAAAIDALSAEEGKDGASHDTDGGG